MGKSTISMAILAIFNYQRVGYEFQGFKPLSGACWLGLVERFDHAVITPNQDPLQIRLIARIIEVTGLSKQKMFLKTQTHNDPNIIK